MICFVVLQNCVDIVEDGTGSGSETFVTFVVVGLIIRVSGGFFCTS